MKSAKCPSCGASVTINETKGVGVCEFCGTTFIADKEVSITSGTSNNAQTIINNYYGAPNQTGAVNQPVNQQPIIKYVEPRPRVRIWLAILLLYFYVFPGIIYISVL